MCVNIYIAIAYHPNKPNVSLEEQYGPGNITAFLQWTEELNNSLVTYHVSVEPMASVNNSTGRANLTLSYNTRYNVSVVADICGRINATTSLMVNYGKHILTIMILNPSSPFLSTS